MITKNVRDKVFDISRDNKFFEFTDLKVNVSIESIMYSTKIHFSTAFVQLLIGILRSYRTTVVDYVSQLSFHKLTYRKKFRGVYLNIGEQRFYYKP